MLHSIMYGFFNAAGNGSTSNSHLLARVDLGAERLAHMALGGAAVLVETSPIPESNA